MLSTFMLMNRSFFTPYINDSSTNSMLSVMVVDIQKEAKMPYLTLDSPILYIFNSSTPRSLQINNQHHLFESFSLLIKDQTKHRIDELSGLNLMLLLKSDVVDIDLSPEYLPLYSEVFYIEGKVLPSKTKHYIREFMRESKLSANDSIFLKSLSLLITKRIASSFFQRNNSGKCPRMDPVLRQVIEYIHHNLHQNITLKMIAKDVHLSPRGVERRFNETVGISVKKYIMEKRLDRSQKMLSLSATPITQIALDCGYNSVSYMAKRYNLKHGISPNDYRIKYGGSDDCEN